MISTVGARSSHRGATTARHNYGALPSRPALRFHVAAGSCMQYRRRISCSERTRDSFPATSAARIRTIRNYDWRRVVYVVYCQRQLSYCYCMALLRDCCGGMSLLCDVRGLLSEERFCELRRSACMWRSARASDSTTRVRKRSCSVFNVYGPHLRSATADGSPTSCATACLQHSSRVQRAVEVAQ